MANSGQVTVRGRFAPNSTVKLYLRRGDVFNPTAVGDPVASAKYGDEATFTGLQVGERYWAAQETDGEWRHAAVTGKEPPVGKPKSDATLDPGWVTQGIRNRRITTGPRSTVDATAVRKGTTMPALHEKQDNPELAPGVGQADVEGPQRSATPIGEGTPLDPDEPRPRPSQQQDEFKSGKVPQRSDTPLGEATPKQPEEVAPSLKQKDVGGPQRSSTPHGEAEPIPEPGDPVKAAERRDASVAKARGETPANPLEKSAPKAKGSKSSRSAKKATGKRNAARKSTAREGTRSSTTAKRKG